MVVPPLKANIIRSCNAITLHKSCWPSRCNMEDDHTFLNFISSYSTNLRVQKYRKSVGWTQTPDGMYHWCGPQKHTFNISVFHQTSDGGVRTAVFKAKWKVGIKYGRRVYKGCSLQVHKATEV
jgi:hypothetical protein